MKDWKILRRHNRLEVVILMGIVLGGRCPGAICPGGQISQEEIVRVQLSGGNFPRWELYGGTRGPIVLGGNCPGGNCLGGNFPGGKCPGGIVLIPFFYFILKTTCLG